MNGTLRLLVICIPLTISEGVTLAGAGQGAEPWGESVEGVQLRVALTTAGPPVLPGELPGFEVQIRNQGSTPVAVNLEALIYAQVEIDDVWYFQIYEVTGTTRPVVIAPGSYSEMVRTRYTVSLMFEMDARPARRFELRPGPHRIRVRNLSLSLANVHGTDGRALVLVSNRIPIDTPEWSASAEREALVAQTAAGGVEGIPAAQRLVARYPDAVVAAIERAMAATTDPAVRSQYVELAGTIPDERVIPFLMTQIAPGVGLASQMSAAEALLAHGRDDGLWPLMETWEQIERHRRRTGEEARRLEFLVRTGHPQIIDSLGRMWDLPVDVRFAIVELFLPPSRNGSSRKVLDGSRGGASLAMAVFPGNMMVLPGGAAGAAAVERLLGVALDDIGAVPLEGRHGDVTYTRPRVCDMAAFVLSLRWPAKYQFTWSDDAADRDRQVAIIKARWRRP